MTPRRLAAAVLFVLALGAYAQAQAPAGTAHLAGTAKLAVRGCGADKEPHFSSTVTLLADGSWSATDSEGDTFAGTWVAGAPAGRRFDLALDAGTEADLVATVASDVGLLCDAPGDVVVTSTVRKRFTLTLNRTRTKAKLVLRYAFRGTANGRSGTAGYRVRAKGPFTAAV